MNVRALGFALCGLVCASPPAARAQDPAAFFAGKTMTFVVGFVSGASMDATARVLAMHMTKHIPGNPKFIIQNMPGAGSLVAANHVFNVAPKDGTVIGLFSETIPLAPLWKLKGTQYDPRQVGWIGSTSGRPTALVLVRSDAPATTIDGAKNVEIVVGATGPGTPSAAYPRLLNALLGTKFRVVLGYSGGPAVNLAIERNELQGLMGWSWASLNNEKPDWVATKFVTVMAQLARKPNPGLAGVPLIVDLAQTPEDRKVMDLVFRSQEMNRPFAVAPGIPADRLKALRDAFDATMTDPSFVEDATKSLPDPLEVTNWKEMTDYVEQGYSTSPETIERISKIMALE